MRIACIDKSAALRITFQRLIDGAFEACRDSIGHLNLAQTFPASREEVLLNSPPDIALIGPGFPADEAFSTCRDIREAFPALPIIVFLDDGALTLRVLRRLQSIATDVLGSGESTIRIVHKISLLDSTTARRAAGRLLVFRGAKGGVGATSLVGGLAHAAQAAGKRVVVLDLSAQNVLCHYFQTEKTHSPDYAAALQESLSFDRKMIERCLSSGPNGISLFLPPSGGAEMREKWLREAGALETNLSALEILQDLFDLVLVDTAQSEGILPFALLTRADQRLLVTSNDPASVHLARLSLVELTEIPGGSETHILLNAPDPKGLKRDDIIDFLLGCPSFREEMCAIPTIPFDRRGSAWIGSGNSFYTESTRTAQLVLDRVLLSLVDPATLKRLPQPALERDAQLAPLVTWRLFDFAGNIGRSLRALTPSRSSDTSIEERRPARLGLPLGSSPTQPEEASEAPFTISGPLYEVPRAVNEI